MSEQPTEGVAAPITELPAMAGDGWVNCAQGHGHWGRFGAAGLLPVHRAPDGEVSVLMHHRAAGTDQGETWSLLGGARDSHESAAQAAVREAVEESDLDAAGLHAERVVRDDHGGWSYDTVIVSLDRQLPVRPVEGESLALAWVPLSEVPGLDLHPGFAASWPRVRAELEVVLSGGSAVPGPTAAAVAAAAARDSVRLLPAHPVTGAYAAAAEALGPGVGTTRRELVTFDDGTRAVFEEHVRTEDVVDKVLDAYVGRAVGARVPLAHPVGPHQVYLDHMPGEPASARHQSLADLSHLAATRDGVFLGLHHAVTASHGLTVDQLVLGDQQSLITVGDGAAFRGHLPDAGNPFVATFFRQTQPQVFAWADHPIPAGDVEVMRHHLDALRPLFEHVGRTGLHDTVMERFDHVAQHAVGAVPLLTRPPGDHVTLPVPEAVRSHDRLPPQGSPERADHQRTGEALLTDDGRITDTPQAKTIAIRALAERMRSTTPELVLAAMGLHVGNDMADHLGDGRYVLVPHNERYPSMGAAVMALDELDPAEPKHAADRVVPMDSPEADTLIRMIAVSELMGSWSYGSNNNVRVLALQEAAREEFGLTEVLEWRTDRRTASAVGLELDYNRDALREFLRTQYDMTQEALAARGITEVISYRALSWPDGAGQPDWADLDIGDTFEARQRPLASWSADRQIVADWLEQRGGRGVVLADRKPAGDILSIPMTGMGYFAQKEWVTLPGDGLVTLDGVFDGGPPAPTVEQTAASSIALGAPALDDAVETPAEEARHGPAPAAEAPRARWRPLTIATELDPADAFDHRIARILDGQEEPPGWWPRDDSGYAITKRDLDFLGINPVQIKWLLTGEAPMGMTPQLYQDFRAQMLEALARDGIEPAHVDIRLKGTGAGFFSGIHKALPQEEDLADNPEAAQRLREWLGDDQDRPVRRPYDVMWRMGLEAEPSDFDLDINSTAIVRAAREHWNAHHADRYPGDFMGGHGYLAKQAVAGALPALSEWAERWEETLGRPISLGVFESSGPFDATRLGRSLSSHFRATDWVIHRADAQPYTTRDEAARAGEAVTARFQTWIGGAMGQELAASAHPRVAAFREAWRQLPSLDAEPAPSVGPYGRVAERAKALITVVSEAARFTPGDIEALQQLAKAAETHSVRLAATRPPGPAVHRQALDASRAPAPQVATPQPTAPRSPRLST
ncbi:NUDIX hydrolase [Streptomyces xanthophaeus]|uniref:NUDIX hydrolase n=1 Tax=Streptomyces xanthophaeus TaxID=67385 RepID=UPI0036593D22